MAHVQVFQLNEYDAVAAKSEEQAKEFYLSLTGMDEDEAFPEDITVLPLNTKVWKDENMESKVTVQSIVEDRWTGLPFIATSTEF